MPKSGRSKAPSATAGGSGRTARSPKTRAAAAAAARRKVTDLCGALPATDCTVKGDHVVFRVRGKVFAYFLDDHHGDGIVSVCVKSELGENLDRVRFDADRYYLPAYIGARGWFGMRLDRGRVDWREVASMLERSFRLTAPPMVLRKLAAACRAA